MFFATNSVRVSHPARAIVKKSANMKCFKCIIVSYSKLVKAFHSFSKEYITF